MNSINWNDLQVFLAIAENRTLSAAARSLDISQPTVSRKLRQMETRLGVELFHPGTSGYELTQAGEEILEPARHVESEVSNIDRLIFGHDRELKGPLRISCTQVMASVYLSTYLANFIKINPHVDLSVVCTYEYVSLTRREADVAIRITGEPSETLAGKRACNVAVGVYTSMQLAEKKFKQKLPQNWDWIGWHDESFNRLVINSVFPDARIRHRVDDMLTMRNMASEGLGVVALPCYMGENYPGLVRLLPDPIHKERFGLWLLYHPDVRKVARVRAFVDYISEAVQNDKKRFAGTD